MLRIFVFSLLLVNILLITMRMLQPEPDTPPEVVRPGTPAKNLPTIELAESQSVGVDRSTLSVDGQPAQNNPEISQGSVAELPNSTPAQQSGPMACIRIGPFETEEEYAALETELQSLFDQVQPRESRSFVDNGYWVYVPAYESRSQASQAVGALSAAGASDYYIVPDGEMQNSISLGVYERRERAELRRQQLNNLGLTMDFMVEPQTKLEIRYYLEAGPVNSLNPTLIELSYNNPDTPQVQIDCSSGEFLP